MDFVKGIKEDIQNTLTVKARRQQAIENTPANPLPKTYGVNDLAASLHPIATLATIKAIEDCTSNTKIIVLQAKKFPYFLAGTYCTLSMNINGKVVTRPYSIYSSPKEAMSGVLKVGIQTVSYFSTYITKQAKVGDKVIVGEPSGDFHYDPLRDKKTILAIAGGSGVTPFVSMMKSVLEGSEDFNITLLYGVKTLKDMMINPKDYVDPRIKIVPVLSDEEVKGCEHGFISKDILSKYVNDNVSIFMCGPNAMYKFVNDELSKLGYDLNKVRQEHNCASNLKLDNPLTYNLTVHIRGDVFKIKARQDETLLVAMEREGLLVPSRCRSGSCGFCHSRLIKGSILTPKELEHRRLADFKFNYIHPCSTYPLSDIEIDVPPYDQLKEIK